MKKTSNQSTNENLIRKMAEEKLASKQKHSDEHESKKLLHELQVHQLELEMQNDELKKALIQKSAALDNYAELYNFAPIPYLTIGRNGIIQHANHAAASLLGKARKVLDQLRLGFFISDATLPLFNAFLDKAFASSENQSYETELFVDGNTLSVILHTSHKQQEADLLVGIVDITQQKLSQQLLIENEFKLDLEYLQLQTFITNTPDLIWLKDTNGIYLNCNSRFESFFGEKAKDIIGKTDYDFVDKKLADFFKLHDKAAMQSDNALVNEEQITFSDGHTEWLETTKIAILGQDDKIIGVMGIGRNITEHKLSEAVLLEKEKRLQLTLATSKQSWFDLNLQTGEILVSPHYPEMLGYDPAEFHSSLQGWQDNLHPDDREAVMTAFHNCLSSDTNTTISMEYRRRKQDGSWLWLHSTAEISERGSQQQPLRVIGIHADISDRKHAEDKLKLAASVFTHAREGITITDAEGIILDVNDTFCNTTGYSREEAIGQNPSILKSGRQSPEFYADMWKSILNEGYWYGEVWNRRKNGEVYAEMKTISAVRDEHGVTTNYVALCTDITPMKEHQIQLERIAHYDVLTNLPNRSLLADRLSQAMFQCSRYKKSLAVVFLDLDGFKEVNDAYGHNVGDELLIALSHRMKEALREGDTLSRIGGDEFVAVLTELVKVEDCKPVLDRLLLAASKPIPINDITLNVSASIGITLYPQDSVDADQLMRHADQSMYTAKQAGKNQYKFFDTEKEYDTINKNDRLTEIQQALINNEFQLYYQPKVNMVTGKVFGVEALVRWNHPEQGLVPPLDFLPLIDGTDLEIQLGEWVTNQAVTQLDLWQKQDCQLEVSINISCHHLLSNNFMEQLAKALAKYPAVNSQLLQLEILESSVLSDINAINQVINNCQITLGINFALDDFGTGYSSLTHLRNLSANTVKIDQSFIRDMLDDPNDYAIIDGVIRLADSFNRDVIAEGVETTNHGLMLLLMGCEQAQGYGIAKPMPVDQLTNWLSNYLPNPEWQLWANKLRSKKEKEKERELFRLTTARWSNKFVTKILSEPEASNDWPLLDDAQCPCGSWLKRAKRAQLFDRKGLELIIKAHKKVHLIADDLFIKYQQGKLDEARNGLVELQVIFDNMNTALDLCD